MTKTATKASPGGWFEVDRDGLAKLCERRGKEFVVHELVANAWDTGAKKVDIELTPTADPDMAALSIDDDDPDGFRDLAHAYTLFAESERKGIADKRGRFGLGEKLVLALCETAAIVSTKGSVVFAASGRIETKTKREAGTRFSAVVRMTEGERIGVGASIVRLVAPEGVETTFNGTRLQRRVPLRTVEAILHTEVSDARGILRRTERKTSVEIHEPLPGYPAAIYEMGIPVVDTGDRYDVNVGQKIPLTVERDNVLPAYLRDVRAVVLNAMAADLAADDAPETWVAEAIADETVTASAVVAALTARFGEKRVGSDPSDREAEHRAKGAGYVVVPSGAFSREAWKNIRRHGALVPAGQVFPTQKPDSDGEGRGRPTIESDDWTPGMHAVVHHASEIARRVLNVHLRVVMINDRRWGALAAWQRVGSVLNFNVALLGQAWFSPTNRKAINSLLIHEFGHDAADGGNNHLHDGYHTALCDIGAALAEIYATDSGWFSNLLAAGADDPAAVKPPRRRRSESRSGA